MSRHQLLSLALGAVALAVLALVVAAVLVPLPRQALPPPVEPWSLPAAVLPVARGVPPSARTPPPLTLVAVGDLMLDRNVAAVIRQHGASYLFDRVRPLLRGADITFGNLEGPMVARYRPTVTGSFVFSFPSSTAALLRAEGFTVVGLANNHGFDHGAAGFAQTQDYLRAAGVQFAGHPKIIADDYAAAWEVRGQPVTMLA